MNSDWQKVWRIYCDYLEALDTRPGDDDSDPPPFMLLTAALLTIAYQVREHL